MNGLSISRNRPFHTCLCLVAVWVSLLAPVASEAEKTVWTSATGGSFSDGTNWDNGIPGSNDDARFDLPNNGLVSVIGDIDVNSVLVNSNLMGFVTTAIEVDEASTLTANDRIEVVTGSLTLQGEGEVMTGLLALGQQSSLTLQGGVDVTSTGNLNGSSNNGTPRTWLIAGTGTTLDVKGNTVLGNFGSDEFTVGPGAAVSMMDIQMNSEANLILDGGSLFGSALNNTFGGTLDIRYGSLAIDGGVFQPGGTDFKLQGNALGSATLTLANIATFNANGELVIADMREGVFEVLSGSTVSSTVGTVGDQATGDGDARVSGVGSAWTNSGNLRVGRSGAGSLLVEDGGTVSSDVGWLGVGNGSNGTATVTGIGSFWSNSSTLNVGAVGTGILRIQNGGSVSNVGVLVGRDSGSDGSVTVTGAGSSWNSSGNVIIGREGEGSPLVQNGATASNAIGEIGERAGSNGAVTIDGVGSPWNSSDELVVGARGFGTLVIQNGAIATSQAGYVGRNAGGLGLVAVDGSGSSWHASSLIDIGSGLPGSSSPPGGGTLNVSDQGLVMTGGTLRLLRTGAINLDGGTIRAMNFDNSLGGGLNHMGGDLIVDGGFFDPGSDGGSAYVIDGIKSAAVHLVNGATSQLMDGLNLWVGDEYAGNLSVSGGSVFTSDLSFVAVEFGSTGEVNVDGVGSTWFTESASIGFEGYGVLNVSAGGAVAISDDLTLGARFGADADATVTGSNSRVSVFDLLTVGDQDYGNLSIMDGGADQPPRIVPVVKLSFAAPLGQPLHVVEA